tara:strand:- start:5788 stop:6132 length:345 start_codon:yes stop_codon:yes gene_type:complete
MKIQSKLPFNTSILARHKTVDKESQTVVIGGLMPEYLNIPSGSTVELSDEEWKKFSAAAEGMIENGELVLLVAPKLSDKEVKEARAAKIAAARAVLAEEEAEEVPKKPAAKKAK